jgi:hypothetical protein
MSMPAMCAGDVVCPLQRFTYADRDRFLADIKMRQARHQRSRIELVDLRFELADGDHLPVHPEPQRYFFRRISGLCDSCHF